MAQPPHNRPVRIANCSGASSDPGIHMYNQAKFGPVDVITGDYLAEINLGQRAALMKSSEGEGWAPTALDGLDQSLNIIAEKGIKVVINGGAINPRGLAERVAHMAKDRSLKLTIAYVDGDNLVPKIDLIYERLKNGSMTHLDGNNKLVQYDDKTFEFLNNADAMPIISANAYLGYRSIKRALEENADIVICGRVSDASPVIGAAAWWHGWSADNYDALAGALVGGHLIECSTYVTGGNFAGFYRHDFQDLLRPGLPILEVDNQGEVIVTKHEALSGVVTSDTVKCQLLYEIQGNIYLNSDVKADISGTKVKTLEKNRVHVSGIKGYPPPDSTKLAIFYEAGYQCETTFNATGYATDLKWDLHEAQIRNNLNEWGLTSKLDVLEFQRVGIPKENPDSQLSSTTYMRMFGQAKDSESLRKLVDAWLFNSLSHFAGMHLSMDTRTAVPKKFLGYFPALFPQAEIEEAANILSSDLVSDAYRIPVGAPMKTEPLASRANYDTKDPSPQAEFGPTIMRPLGDIALGRSGDKGANVNFGIFVETSQQWEWLRSFMSREQMRKMMGKDWQPWFHIERVELPYIFAINFVIYGPLGRGVSSSLLLDSLGKGFGEFIRAVHVPIPTKLLVDPANENTCHRA